MKDKSNPCSMPEDLRQQLREMQTRGVNAPNGLAREPAREPAQMELVLAALHDCATDLSVRVEILADSVEVEGVVKQSEAMPEKAVQHPVTMCGALHLIVFSVENSVKQLDTITKRLQEELGEVKILG